MSEDRFRDELAAGWGVLAALLTVLAFRLLLLFRS
jgi:hypothetical protein